MMDISLDRRERETARLRAVMTVSRKINSILDLEKLLDETVRVIKETFNFALVSVYLLDQHEQEYLYHMACSDPGHNHPHRVTRRVHVSMGMVGWVIRNERTRLANDVSRDPYYIHCVGTQAELDMPLKVNDRCIGVLNIEQPNINAFDPEDVPVLEILAEQIATAIESARLHARAREAAVAEERNRLARELHDDTVQSLIGIGRQIDLLRCDLTDTLKNMNAESVVAHDTEEDYQLPEHIEKRLNRLQDSLDSTIGNLRLLSRQLQPKILSDLGLVAGLEGLASDINRFSEITVTTELDPDAVACLNPSQQLNLYRLAQEALTNIVKHAKAHTAQLQLAFEKDTRCVELTICDDGVGFEVPEDLTRLAWQGGMGVINMRQRARETGGCLKIDSEPGKGTTLVLRLCLDETTPVHTLM